MSVAGDIILGKHDDELDAIAQALLERRAIVGRAKAVDMRAGTQVKIAHADIRPSYLDGLTGVVKSKGPKNVVVTFDDPRKARRYATGIRIPPEFLVVLEGDEAERARESRPSRT